jgi:phosphoserine phosphatase
MGYRNNFYLFDMDGTLTDSRRYLSLDMECALIKLAKRRAVVIISGATSKQMDKQIPFRTIWKEHNVNLTKMSQNGNICEARDERLWERRLHVFQRMAVFSHIHKLLSTFGGECLDSEDLVEDRGCQVSYSLIGHNAPSEMKSAFDPDGNLRRRILKAFPFDEKSMTVKVGGTTCLDYIEVDGTKADNLKRLLGPAELKRATYVGDQLYPGGNDSDVRTIEGLDCLAVKNPTETLEFIEMELESL